MPLEPILDAVIVVSGLPRSGTSLMMQMLDAGGVPVVTDSVREPDPDNPRGYFELAATKSLASDSAWVREHRGEALKVVAPLLRSLPEDVPYRVVFMERDLGEVMASQRAMLARQGAEPRSSEEGALATAFERMLRETRDWLGREERVETLFVGHAGVLADPAKASAAVAEFLALDLDRDAMAKVVSPDLHRQRQAGQR